MASGADPILANLDPDQREAVLHTGSPTLVLSPAGTGKTSVIAARIAHQLATGLVRPSQVLALTFTNKAAATLRSRIDEFLALCGSEAEIDRMWVGTIHHACARILRNHPEEAGLRPGFAILDDEDSLILVKRLLRLENPDLATLPDELARSAASLQRRLFSVASPSPPPACADDRALIAAYESELQTLNAVDFDGLLQKTLALLDNHPKIRAIWRNAFSSIAVDEFQDLDDIQIEIIQHLVARPDNLFACGDDDQGIFGFRHANIAHILGFERRWGPAKVIVLRRNYRSHPAIIKAAAKLIAHNPNRRPKSFIPAVVSATPGAPVNIRHFDTDLDEAAWIAERALSLIDNKTNPGEIACLVRTNRMADPISGAMHARNIPVVLVGQAALHQRPSARLALAWLAIAEDPAAELAYERIATSEPFLLPPAAFDAAAEIARGKNIPLRVAALAYPERIGFSSDDRAALAALEGAIRRHSTLEPPPARLRRLLDDPALAAAWHAAGAGPTPGEPRRETGSKDDLAELADRLRPHHTIRDYLASAHFEAGETEIRTLSGEIDRVRIMTCHAAKGTQALAVFIPGWEEKTFPLPDHGDPGHIEEERRLAYVALTRARAAVFITTARKRGNRQLEPSRFLPELGIASTPRAA